MLVALKMKSGSFCKGSKFQLSFIIPAAFFVLSSFSLVLYEGMLMVLCSLQTSHLWCDKPLKMNIDCWWLHNVFGFCLLMFLIGYPSF